MNTVEAPKYHEAFIAATNGEYPTVIQCQLETGEIEAFPYAYLTRMKFNKSGLITIEFTTAKVEIKGRRLDKLFAPLVHYQVVSVRQHSITDVRPPPGECCIDALTIRETER